MNRRDLMVRLGIVMGGALSPSLLRALTAEKPLGDALSVLAPTQRMLAGTLAETLIPTTDSPGALAAGVDVYIDQALGAFFSVEERNAYVRGLELLDEYSKDQTGEELLALDETTRHDLVAALDNATFIADEGSSELQDFYRMHKGLTITGYYTSEVGQTVELHLPPMGAFDADVPLAEIGRSWA